MRSIYFIFYACIIIYSCSACKKGALEEKPASAILVPGSLNDFQELLDNTKVFDPGTFLGYLSGDEFFFSPSYYNSTLLSSEKNAYTWEKIIFAPTETSTDWSKPFEQVYYCNVVIEGLNHLPDTVSDTKKRDAIMGDALFKRSLSFFHLVQLFAPAYDTATAATDLGIPLKLTTSTDEKIFRSTMEQCYQKMLGDLSQAAVLLPPIPDPAHRNRSCSAAALALQARLYLCMGKWQQTVISAQSALQLYDSLINYNTLDTITLFPFEQSNKEVLYPVKMPEKNNLFPALVTSGATVDTVLTRSYTPGDLRPLIFFHQRSNGSFSLKGSLTGDLIPFMGLPVSEVYLTLAEAYARLGDAASAVQLLNRLLQNRWKTGRFVPLTAANANEALRLVLNERYKELAFRGMRWADIKRLNKQNLHIALERNINGKISNLGINDPRYALPLPDDAVLKYGLMQNLR